MPELGKADGQPSREPDSVKGHHRAVLSIDQSRPLIPETHFQYGGMHRGHQRQLSEAPFAAIPKHMRTTSVQEAFGHGRDLSTSSGLHLTSSPFLIPGTPDMDSYPGFQQQDPSQQPIPFQTPQVVQGIFAVSGQPPADQRMLSHNGTPILFDQSTFSQFQGVLQQGSPGPLHMYSPNLKGAINTKFTGLTPLLNFSPYPDHTPDLQNTPRPPEIGDHAPPIKIEKHPLGSPDDSSELQSTGLYSPNKKSRIDDGSPQPLHITDVGIGNNNGGVRTGNDSEIHTSDITDENAMEVPADSYSEEAINHAWTEQDVEEMLALLEHAERFKWRYISEQFYDNNHKRIPGIACSKKYRDLFGVPESSSLLGSSLFYVAFRRGWSAIKEEYTAMERDLKEEVSN